MSAKIAIIYDRATVTHGGAEQVLLALHKLYPQAALFTSVYDPKKASWAKAFVVKASFLQKIPLARKLHRYLAILMPLAFEFLDLSGYEIIISVTSAEAKGVITRRDQLHFCYLLSPTRYLYHYREEYLQKNHLLNFFPIRWLAQTALNYLKKWDQVAIFRPDLVTPIAKVVAQRAHKYYPRLQTAHIIYPPVDRGLLEEKPTNEDPSNPVKDYFLLVARLVPYKNVDAAILACQRLGYHLIIVGEGPEKDRLKSLIRTKLITFRSYLSQAELAELYRHCLAVLSPGLDDFSITALEGNLFGKPVVINQLAGASELITHRKHGLHFPYKEGDRLMKIANNLQNTLQDLTKMEFDSRQLQKNALKYDTNSFARNFGKALSQAYQAKKEGKL